MPPDNKKGAVVVGVPNGDREGDVLMSFTLIMCG